MDLLYNEINELLDSDLSESELLKLIESENSAEVSDNVCNDTDIAVIGMSGRFSDADDIDELWENLKNGKCSIRKIDRWDEEEYYSPDREAENKSYSKWGAFISDIYGFDPDFFNINPKEAELMDPQQRIVLMESWRAFENAGYCRKLSGMKCGIYIGVADNSYDKSIAEPMSSYRFIGNNNAILSGRLAYFYDTKGPALTIDTACSSSLTSLAVACSAIIMGDVDMALVGGVTVFSSPEMYIGTSKCGMLSETGECRTFDRDANGFVPGEGCGFLVIKKLSDAVRDNDRIQAVIKGSYLNQDGKTNGITSPNSISQYNLQKELFKKYKINPRNISYVEAHGTGTKLGDPIEVESLTNSFRDHNASNRQCAIGSVKTNIGHTVAAAGIAGVIKCILMMKHGKLVASLGCDNINPLLDLENTPFYISDKFCDWRPSGKKRMALVNSFGFSGTNACVVLEEYVDTERYVDDLAGNTVCISAKTPYSLRNILKKYRDYKYVTDNINDIAFTASLRQKFDYTAEFTVDSVASLREKIASVLSYSDDEFIRNTYDIKNGNGISCTGKKTDLPSYCFDMRKNYISDKSAISNCADLTTYKEICIEKNTVCHRSLGNEIISIVGFPEKCVEYFRKISNGNVLSSEFQKDISDIADIYIINAKAAGDTQDQTEFILNYFECIRSIVRLNGGRRIRIISVNVCTAYAEDPAAEALDSFAVQLHSENPMISFSSVSFDADIFDDELYVFIGNEIYEKDAAVYYDEHCIRRIISYKKLSIRKNNDFGLRSGGNYVFTGGLGGVGRIFLKYFCDVTECSCFVIGRSSYDADIAELIAEADISGRKIKYISGDITDAEEAKKIADDIKNKVGNIDGIIHGAGIFKNDFIINKDIDDFRRVAETKIKGVCNLDKFFMSDSTDFFVMFSSLDSIVGKAGQCDYVYANRFLDCFSRSKNNSLIKNGMNRKYISLNWPYWINGGMHLTDSDVEDLGRKFGLVAMEDQYGVKAFNEAIYCDADNLLVFYGNAGLFEKAIEIVDTDQKDIVVEKAVSAKKSFNDTNKVAGIVIGILRELTGNELIDETTEIVSINADSLLINDFNIKIEKHFEGIPKTIIYECSTVKEMCDYICKLQPEIDVPEIMHTDECDDINSVEDIAVIGLSGIYPDADDIEMFWKNIQTGKYSIKGFPFERWKKYSRGLDTYSDRIYCKKGGFLDRIDDFDCMLFNISPKTAALMDPQERKLLEVAFDAISDSGYSRKSLSGKVTGVFIGSTTNSFIASSAELWCSGKYRPASSRPWSLANRISYYFDFKGPSIGIDTACSSGLTALYYACRSITSKECDVAIAGGVNMYSHPEKYLTLCENRMLSVSGASRPFGEGADGFVPGEGAGCVVLKALDQAEKDGDHIYGVIKAIKINHGGRSNGYYVPDVRAQEMVINSCIDASGLKKEDITYIETHGTGTDLGDPIELAGLNNVFGRNPYNEKRCSIGSVKANIGHLEAASGMASLTKVLLMLREKKIPPMINCSRLNHKLDLKDSYFAFPQQCAEWKESDNGIRAAGISSFGAGGVNVHAIISEYKGERKKSAASRMLTLPLTAVSCNALRKYADCLAGAVENTYCEIDDLAYTLQRSCQNLPKRAVVIADCIESCVRSLKKLCQSDLETERIFGEKSISDDDINKWIEGRKDFEYDPELKGNIIDLPSYPFERETFDLNEDLKTREEILDENLSNFRNAEYSIIDIERLPKLMFKNEKSVNTIFEIDAIPEFFSKCLKKDRITVRNIISASPCSATVKRFLISSSDGKECILSADNGNTVKPAAKAVFTDEIIINEIALNEHGFSEFAPKSDYPVFAACDSEKRNFRFIFSGCFGYTRQLYESIDSALYEAGIKKWAFICAETVFMDRSLRDHRDFRLSFDINGNKAIMDINAYDNDGRSAFSAKRIQLICL